MNVRGEFEALLALPVIAQFWRWIQGELYEMFSLH
jgi:hypothetical protein